MSKKFLVIELNNSELLAFLGCFGFIFSLPNFKQIFLNKIFPILIENSSNILFLKILYLLLLFFIIYESYFWIVQLANNIQRTSYLRNVNFKFYLFKIFIFGLLGFVLANVLNNKLF